MFRDLSETICALSTPEGRSGVGLIRVSGDRAFEIAEKLCLMDPGKLFDRRSHSLIRAALYGPNSDVIDDAVLGIYRGPRSFTGEDTVEVMAHGGPVPLRKIIERLLELGCRHASPGEFSQRAFMNGRIDLVQAEAIADIIASETDQSHALAITQETGSISRAMQAAKDLLLPTLAAVEASIDFPEDVGELDYAECIKNLNACCVSLDQLIASAHRGILFREGIRFAIVGRPNAGKSSLLNALLRHERSIVTPTAGTTRDTIEEGYNLHGIPLRAIDTAGIRKTSDNIESIGIARSRNVIRQADAVVHLFDATIGVTEEDVEIREIIGDKPHLNVWNKCDIAEPPILDNGVQISVKSGVGVPGFEDRLFELVTSGTKPLQNGEAVVTHARQARALRAARESCDHARVSAENGLPPDFISIDLMGALNFIGEVTGETAPDDVINEIFSRFCIGK